MLDPGQNVRGDAQGVSATERVEMLGLNASPQWPLPLEQPSSALHQANSDSRLAWEW